MILARKPLLLTWWVVWVILGKGHLCLEIASVVCRVRVERNECDVPLEDVFVDKLYNRSITALVLSKESCNIPRC